MLIVVFIFSISYLLFGVLLIHGWYRAKRVIPRGRSDQEELYSFTVLIPVRNEENNIAKLLESLKRTISASHTKFQIIVIDDHSSDRTMELTKNAIKGHTEFEIVDSSGQGKIAAVKTGLEKARYEAIVSLDGDVVVKDNWAKSLVLAMENCDSPDMMILPVVGLGNNTLASRYAALDFLALIGTTFSFASWGRPIMANAAHMFYRKSFADWPIDTISGDDVFLLHNVKSAHGKICVGLDKELIVETKMPATWKEVFEQRIRWASKSMRYKDNDTLFAGWYVLILNVFIWVLFTIVLFRPDFLSLFLTLMITKIFVDGVFLAIVAKWFGRSAYMIVFPFAWVLNSLMFPVIFIFYRIVGFTWKGRSYR